MSRCLRMLDGVDSSSLLYKLALDPLLIEPGAENKWSTLCGTFNKERAQVARDSKARRSMATEGIAGDCAIL